MEKKLSFTKMTGAGNDFIVFGSGCPALRSADIVHLCDRKYGIGADGVMALRDGAGEFAFAVDFWNSDGSSGMLCGNGARCILEYARLTGRIALGRETAFSFAGSPYSGEILEPGLVRFDLSPNFRLEAVDDLELDGQRLRGHFVDVGSPHFVIQTGSIPRATGASGKSGPNGLAGASGEFGGGGVARYVNLDEVPVFELGRRIRLHRRFAPRGVNANFIELKEGKVFVRTYERGVEDETLACGTGSTASALVCLALGLAKSPVRIVTRSSEELVIGIGTEEGRITSLSLTGPARKIFSGSISL